jgi:hypothetical protein
MGDRGQAFLHSGQLYSDSCNASKTPAILFFPYDDHPSGAKTMADSIAGTIYVDNLH